MRKKTRWIIVWLFGVILFGFAGAGQVSAADLPRGMVIADNDGVTVDSSGEYFIDIPSARPGDIYRKEITLRSTTTINPFELSIRVRPGEATGAINWNDHITLTLRLDGKEIYRGKILGDGTRDWTKEGLSLGQFGFGTDKVLEATYEINGKLTNQDFAKESVLTYTWEYIATNTTPSSSTTETSASNSGDTTTTTTSSDQRWLDSSDLANTNGGGTTTSSSGGLWGRLPQTGEEWRQVIYQVLAGLLLILIVLLVGKKRRQEQQEAPKAPEVTQISSENKAVEIAPAETPEKKEEE